MNRLSTVDCYEMYRHTEKPVDRGREGNKECDTCKIQIVSIYTEFGELLAIKMLN